MLALVIDSLIVYDHHPVSMVENQKTIERYWNYQAVKNVANPSGMKFNSLSCCLFISPGNPISIIQSKKWRQKKTCSFQMACHVSKFRTPKVHDSPWFMFPHSVTFPMISYGHGNPTCTTSLCFFSPTLGAVQGKISGFQLPQVLRSKMVATQSNDLDGWLFFGIFC